MLIRKGLMDVFGQVNHLDKGFFIQMGIHLLEVLNLESMPNLPGTSRDLHTIRNMLVPSLSNQISLPTLQLLVDQEGVQRSSTASLSSWLRKGMFPSPYWAASLASKSCSRLMATSARKSGSIL